MNEGLEEGGRAVQWKRVCEGKDRLLGELKGTQRVVWAWNALPSKMIEADMLGSFKTYLDSDMNRLGIEGYKRMV